MKAFDRSNILYLRSCIVSLIVKPSNSFSASVVVSQFVRNLGIIAPTSPPFSSVPRASAPLLHWFRQQRSGSVLIGAEHDPIHGLFS